MGREEVGREVGEEMTWVGGSEWMRGGWVTQGHHLTHSHPLHPLLGASEVE